MVKIAPELEFHLLDLTVEDKEIISQVIEECPKTDSFLDYAKCLFGAYQEGKIVLTHGLSHLIARIAFYLLHYDRIEEIATVSNSVGARLWEIDIFIKKGYTLKALEMLNILEIRDKSLLDQAEMFNKKSKLANIWGDYPYSLSVTKEAFQNVEELENDPETQKRFHHAILPCYMAMSNAYLYSGDVLKALQIAKEGYKAAKSFNDEILQGRIINVLGYIRIQQGLYKEAEVLFLDAKKLLKEAGYAHSIECKANQAYALIFQGKHMKAIDIFLEITDYWERTQQLRKLTIHHIRLGTAYKGMGAMIQASHHVNIALKILNRNKMEDGRLYGDVADVFLAAQQYDECEKALTYAEDLSKYSSTVFDQMQINTVRGGLELRRFNYGKAEMYLDKALTTSAETEYIDITIRSLLLLAELSTRKYELTSSVDELQIAEQRINDLYIVLKQFNLPQVICELLIIHASLAKAQMKFEHADDLLSQAITLAKAENYYILFEHAQVMRDRLTLPLTQSMKVQPDPAAMYEISKEIEVLGDIYRSITTPQQFSAELSEPLALLIVLPEGIAAFSYVFSDELKGDIHDDLLLGGFLRALSDLSGEIFSKGGQVTSLRSIQYMHYSIMVERRDEVIYSVITNKETYGMRHLLRTLADQIAAKPYLVKYSIKVDKQVQSELYKQVEDVYWAYMNE